MPIQEDLKQFLDEWNNDSPVVLVHTSGSTGVPKPIYVEKERMRASARMTCDFLGLEEGDTALLCMPLQYIAGKMMVVRAIERGLNLVTTEPSGHPLDKPLQKKTCKLFVAMVPAQVWNSIQIPEEAERLKSIDHLIIGGGAIAPQLARLLKDFPNHVWSTYGMTETLSHIALRRLNGPQATEWYTTLPGVSISQNDEGCLVVEAPALSRERLVTHDIIEINETGAFKIIGRTDNVICTGGVKVHIEEVETILHSLVGDTVQVTSVPHSKWGEAIVYLSTKPIDEHLLRLGISNPYWLPKRIINIDALPKTGTGKPDRAKARQIALQAISKKD